MERCIIYIRSKQHLINKAIENKLTEAGFTVLAIEGNIDELNKRRHESDIILCYPEHGDSKTELLMHYIADLCRDERKSLCIIGDNEFITELREADLAGLVTKTYIRPIDMNVIIADMNELSEAHEEFRRRKTILIVDDDDDFLAIMKRWLRSDYDVEAMTNGEDALEYLSENRPDLILLDYEMPEFDGYEIMGRIRKSPSLSRIPLIFLTGVNDRESVMRILKHKPDGYLLKSTKKSELLETIENFFADNIFKK